MCSGELEMIGRTRTSEHHAIVAIMSFKFIQNFEAEAIAGIKV
jgi:hypothetical protein